MIRFQPFCSKMRTDTDVSSGAVLTDELTVQVFFLMSQNAFPAENVNAGVPSYLVKEAGSPPLSAYACQSVPTVPSVKYAPSRCCTGSRKADDAIIGHLELRRCGIRGKLHRIG